MSSGIEMIAAERERQIKEEGWTSEHDDQHQRSELAYAAACYAEFAASGFYPPLRRLNRRGPPRGRNWPFHDSWWKPGIGDDVDARIYELAKAGALIAAEIDRLQRLPND